MGTGFSPLDAPLALLPGPWSPHLVELMVRVGAWQPFAQTPEAIACVTGVELSPDTARRLTEAAGRHLLALDDADLQALRATLPEPAAGPAVQQLSADGAMVPLVGGEWTEAKLLAIGTVTTVPDPETGAPLPHTTDVSYFARVAAAEAFAPQATRETHRRGTATAGTVAAVLDGAVWRGWRSRSRPASTTWGRWQRCWTGQCGGKG